MSASIERYPTQSVQQVIELILGITYDIWERRGIALIRDHYGADAPVYALSGIVRGAAAVETGTRAMLQAFPDRILVGDDVIVSGDAQAGWHSSHRILSTMTHHGDGPLGAPTGRAVRVMTIADCEIHASRITREWLMRDQLSIVRQLGLDARRAAQALRDGYDDETRTWLAGESERVSGDGAVPPACPDPATDARDFAAGVLAALWRGNGDSLLHAAYSECAALHAAADEMLSGRDALLGHYAGLRRSLDVDGVSVDHIGYSASDDGTSRMSVRWSVTGIHRGEFLGVPGSGRRVYVLGASHWRFAGKRIVCEWTVFDRLGVLAQVL